MASTDSADVAFKIDLPRKSSYEQMRGWLGCGSPDSDGRVGAFGGRDCSLRLDLLFVDVP